jgi:hypothetical protein
MGHQGPDQRRAHPPADLGGVPERVIDPNVGGLGGDGVGMGGVVRTAIPLAPADVAAVVHDDECVRGFLTGDALLETVDLPFQGRPRQVPPRDMGLPKPGCDELQVCERHRS